MWFLYQLALVVALAVAAPFLLLTRAQHYLPTLRERLGRLPEAEVESPLWIHAVSVGEVGVAEALASQMPAQELLVTTVTPTGQSLAVKKFGDWPARAQVTYLPFDLGPPISRFLRRFAPRALVLIEGEFWPLLLRTVSRRGLPIVALNARVSDRSFARMRRLAPLARIPLLRVDRYGTQTAADRDRLIQLGVEAERITVTGNVKYETPEPPQLEAAEGVVRALSNGRAVIVAGSTMEGEDPEVLTAFSRLRERHDALLVLAPRHPERFATAATHCREAGWRTARRSQVVSAPASESPTQPMDVLVLDTLGELASVYREAAIAFVGGTLVDTGGHNPIEPARFGVPVSVGPSMHNFREIGHDFERARAWRQVQDAEELGKLWSHWIDEPESAALVGAQAEALIEEHRGAVGRSLELLLQALGESD